MLVHGAGVAAQIGGGWWERHGGGECALGGRHYVEEFVCVLEEVLIKVLEEVLEGVLEEIWKLYGKG